MTVVELTPSNKTHMKLTQTLLAKFSMVPALASPVPGCAEIITKSKAEAGLAEPGWTKKV